MKKYSKVLLLVSFFLVALLPQASFATSGACSDHGGVNCSAGASISGNAICNDGSESSTSYYLTDECNSVSACTLPTTQDCDKNYEGAIAILNSLHGTPEDTAGEIQACETTHNEYEADLATYNACVSANAAVQQDQQNQLIQTAQQEQQAQIQDLNTSCQNASGQYSYYDQTNTKCACQQGYWLDSSNNQCEKPAAVCTNEVGANSYPVGNSGGQCECDSNTTTGGANYEIGSDGQCDPIQEPVHTISESAYNVATGGGSCRTLSGQDESDCDLYASHPYDYDWQVVQPSTTDTNSLATSPAPATTDTPPVPPSPSVPTPPTPKNNPPQAPKELVVSASVSATTTESVASSTVAPVPKQKHWYEWLNPVNWFSWIP